MENSSQYLILASGVKNGEGFWIVGIKKSDKNILEDKNLLDCYRKELIGYQSAKDIIFAIKLNINNLINELRNQNYSIKRTSLGISCDTSDPSVSLLQNRISNNFSRKYCKAINNGLSKDEAMKSAIVKTENIISFSYNPQKKWIEKNDLANQISLQVVNDCGWSFGLIGKEGVDYFKSYFLEIYEKTTPDRNFSR